MSVKNCAGRCLAACIIISYCLQPVLSSYLGYPRINFHGNFRADSDTKNNEICNYRLCTEPPCDPDAIDWNTNGTNEFEFVNAYVTNVIYRDGTPNSNDPLVNRNIIGNLDRPLAKISDGSSRDPPEEVFGIYGMQFGVKWTDKEFPRPKNKEDIAFHGKWHRSVVTQFMWRRIPCYSSDRKHKYSPQISLSVGVQFTSVIEDIFWGDPKKSQAIKELFEDVGKDGKLSVRVSLYFTTRNYYPFVSKNATLGYAVGSIGVHKDDDTLNVPGKRMMRHTDQVPDNLQFAKTDICYEYPVSKVKQWTNFVPFEYFDNFKKPEVRIDLSNSIPTDMYLNFLNFGELRLGVLDASKKCVALLGNEKLNYRDSVDFPKSSGIHSVQVSDQLKNSVASNPLVLAQVLSGNDKGKGKTVICKDATKSALILMKELPVFVRPKGYYINFLEKSHSEENTQEVYVTKYGDATKAAGVKLTVRVKVKNGPPDDGVIPKTITLSASNKGIATFTFKLNKPIPKYRHYYEKKCDTKTGQVGTHELPIDGQIYYFYYSVDDYDGDFTDYNYIATFFLAFSDFDKIENPNWIEHIEKILKPYAKLSPSMTAILDLSNYTAVVSNTRLMKLALGITDLDNPSYMPTNRDLSMAKRNMIIRWLENPLYSDESDIKPVTKLPDCVPSKCYGEKEEGEEKDEYCTETDEGVSCSSEISSPAFSGSYSSNYMTQLAYSEKYNVTSRCHQVQSLHEPVLMWYPHIWEIFQAEAITITHLSSTYMSKQEKLMKKLQEAIQLEWATIPVYLSSLYSIKDNCNREIAKSIRSIVIQEMLHMTQVANILIAMGGSPKIDDPDMAPSFIKGNNKGLPGGVLPELTVTIEKLSLEHIRDVFMVIEAPSDHIDDKAYTIGKFYADIKKLIDELDDEDFKKQHYKQVKWPWSVKEVTDKETACAGLHMIVEQGEGSPIPPSEENLKQKKFSHFFKFEEIYCGRALKYHEHNKEYSYDGEKIPFDESGVWPMRKNPVFSDLTAKSNCYTESRAFHKVYRMLLYKLQEVFNTPSSTDEATHKANVEITLELMESLEVHAKKLMWTKYKPDSNSEETCGVSWEYKWSGPIRHAKQ